MKSRPPGTLKLQLPEFDVHLLPLGGGWSILVNLSLEMVMHLVFATIMVRWLSEIQFAILLMSR